MSGGDKGDSERLAYLYDDRRVVPSGLSGEISLPPAPGGLPEQFDRTPYIAGFRAANEHFTLLTAHIRYGALPADRLPELQRIAQYTAQELRARARTGQSREEPNLLVLRDFNIDKRQSNPCSTPSPRTAWVPQALQGVKTAAGKVAKCYDQIARFHGDDFGLRPSRRAGSIDFAGAVFQQHTSAQVSPRISDHLPLWVEFTTDRSGEQMAGVLGVDFDGPELFASVLD